MAEYTGVFVQQVAAGQNVLFNETPVCGSNCIVHREGAGIVTLRGVTNQCRALYKVVYGGNIAVLDSRLSFDVNNIAVIDACANHAVTADTQTEIRLNMTARHISFDILFSKNRHSGCDFAEQRDLLHRLRFFEKNIRRYMQSLCYFQDVSVFRLIIAGKIFTDG